jgi:alkanesulfonate monooxygenase SsuD/methylene tetrahydromethanopterin reductase-like flavin-dependent oxidoreductase (luciferase family)
LFHVTTVDQWDRNREGYELFRLLWDNEHVTWSGSFRPPLVDAKALPRPLQPRIRIWHGSATSRDSVDLAARNGDPIFSANVTYPIEPYAELVRHYRQRWEQYGHDPGDALVGAGTAGFHIAATTQQAVAEYRLLSSHAWRFSGAPDCRWCSSPSKTSSTAARRSSAARSR